MIKSRHVGLDEFRIRDQKRDRVRRDEFQVGQEQLARDVAQLLVHRVGEIRICHRGDEMLRLEELGLRVREIESHELQLGRLDDETLIETRRGGAEVSCFNTICVRRSARDHRDFVKAQCVC